MANEIHSQDPPTTAGPLLEVPAETVRRRWARQTVANWRLFLVRTIVGGIAVVITVFLVPGLAFTGWRAGEFVVVAITYAVLTALLKPALEFLALRFLVATYGLVVIAVNTLVLFVLAQVLSDFITYDRLWQLLLGGFLVGVLGLMLETAAGANQPVLDSRKDG